MPDFFEAFTRAVEHDRRLQRYHPFLQIVNRHRGEEMICYFIKRSNGQVRRMVFDGVLDTDRDEIGNGLVTVMDLEKDAPRRINLDGLHVLVAGGRKYLFDAEGEIHSDEKIDGQRPATKRDSPRGEFAPADAPPSVEGPPPHPDDSDAPEYFWSE